MPPKNSNPGKKTPTAENTTITDIESNQSFALPRNMSVFVQLLGDAPGSGDWTFLTVFNGVILLDGKWIKGNVFEAESIPINLKDPYIQAKVADNPLIFLIRNVGGKGTKDPDPLLNIDNRAGGTIDLLPLLLGEQEIFTTVSLNLITTGKKTGCELKVRIITNEPIDIVLTPLLITMVSVHCMPLAKDGTVYISAIGLNGVNESTKSVNFGMSLSTPDAEKIVWATANNIGYAADTAINVPIQDKYVPQDLDLKSTSQCRSFYWNAMKRVFVDPYLLRERLFSPFLIEVAGVPKQGKVDVRGRFMGYIDAGVLLEPGQIGVTMCVKLLVYNEAGLSSFAGPLLDLPPTSAKGSARVETDQVLDEYQHSAYVVIRFDLIDNLTSKTKMAVLYEHIGFPSPEGPSAPVDLLDADSPREDVAIDAGRVRVEGGALAVHKELSGLACRGTIPMNQSIKRTAANRLLMRVRAMLKQFPPGDSSEVEWQDTVMKQHAACRRAVTASFAPQPPPVKLSGRFDATMCRMAGDNKLADRHIQNNLKVGCGHPRALFSKVLRCLEARNDINAKNYLLEALSIRIRNRYLLWTLGGLEFDKHESVEVASAAFRIAVKGDCSAGTSNAIGWAALHSFYHVNGNIYAAFVAAKKMRKSFTLPQQWKKFLQRWVESSGEEEVFWIPSNLIATNPLLIAAAFFLCLRCYKFSERLLQCIEEGCAERGSTCIFCDVRPDIYYIRAASLILRRQLDEALETTIEGIKKFGPSPIMSQMKATCLFCLRGWDSQCDNALKEAENAGSDLCPLLLLNAALMGMNDHPDVALQRAARAHKIAPCAHTALVIGRIYVRTGENVLAERWAACAVKAEPLLADGWAILALLAMYERNLDKARTMLRTARQIGIVSMDIEEEVKKVMAVVQLETLPDLLTKSLCFCDYF